MYFHHDYLLYRCIYNHIITYINVVEFNKSLLSDVTWHHGGNQV